MINVKVENFDLLSPKLERENIQLGLSRIKNALRDLDDPCKNIPAVQIVGTNGKGSITAFIENILYADKRDIGVTTCLLYTSPSPRDRRLSRMPSSA